MHIYNKITNTTNIKNINNNNTIINTTNNECSCGCNLDKTSDEKINLIINQMI
jgi:hypothetical protein